MMFGKSKDDSGVGPGMYDLKDSQGGPNIFIGKEPRLTKNSTLSPGPGAYDGNSSVIKAHGPSIKMGSSQRQTSPGKGE